MLSTAGQRRVRRRRLPLTAALLAVAVVTVVAGCSSSGDGDRPASATDPASLLTGARAGLDSASSVHFTLTSADLPTGGNQLIGGDGVITRPASFQGTLSVLLNGSKVSIALTSVDGTVYAKLPFSDSYRTIDPASFGLRDPATLIDPKTGVAQMFDQLSGVREAGRQRIGSDVVTQIDGTVPGPLVDDLLTSADPAQPVKVAMFVTDGPGFHR
jgi:lipoprotein LprG